MCRKELKREQAASPVIAVILMVAITVVLSAVLYVWASSFIRSEKDTPMVVMTSTQTEKGFTISVVKVQGGKGHSVTAFDHFLKDEQGRTVTKGNLEDIYGYKPEHGHGLSFVDNDYNSKVSAGDLILITPESLDGELGNVTNFEDYRFELKFVPTHNIAGGVDLG